MRPELALSQQRVDRHPRVRARVAFASEILRHRRPRGLTRANAAQPIDRGSIASYRFERGLIGLHRLGIVA